MLWIAKFSSSFLVLESQNCHCYISLLFSYEKSKGYVPCQRGLNAVSSCGGMPAGGSTFEHDWQLGLESWWQQSFWKSPSNRLFRASQVRTETSGAPPLSMGLLIIQSWQFWIEKHEILNKKLCGIMWNEKGSKMYNNIYFRTRFSFRTMPCSVWVLKVMSEER